MARAEAASVMRARAVGDGAERTGDAAALGSGEVGAALGAEPVRLAQAVAVVGSGASRQLARPHVASPRGCPRSERRMRVQPKRERVTYAPPCTALGSGDDGHSPGNVNSINPSKELMANSALPT